MSALIYSLLIVYFTLCCSINVNLVGERHDNNNTILFVLHDAGESFGLQPVIDQLLKDQQLSLIILCLGEPSTSIYYYNYTDNAIVLSDVGITDIDIVDGNETREQMLSTEDLNTLVDKLHATMVICGMVYSMEAQICSVSILKITYISV